MSCAFDVSGINLGGFKKALAHRGLLEPTLARCTTDSKEAMAFPHARRWHSGRIALDVWASAIDLVGPTVFAEVQYDVTRDAFGAVVTPLLKVALALQGRSPVALLKRFDEVVKVAARNVTCTWRPIDERTAEVNFDYPCSIPRVDVIEHGWRGSFRFAEALVNKTFTFAPMLREGEGRFVFRFSW